jgi:hypothetical protein
MLSSRSHHSSRHIINCKELNGKITVKQVSESRTVLEPAFITNNRAEILPAISHHRNNVIASDEITQDEISEIMSSRVISHLNLSMEYVNLFKARQKDLKLNSNIDV